MTEKLAVFLGNDLLKIIKDGQKLLDLNEDFYDYAIVVFPVAKAYEGFLKKLFFQIGAISQSQYESTHWRVGRALNPQLEKEIRHLESVYDRIVGFCGGEQLADVLWKAWQKGRNQTFHYFPFKYQPLSKAQAINIVEEIIRAMEKGLEDCQVDFNSTT